MMSYLLHGPRLYVIFAGFAASSQAAGNDSPRLMVKYGDLNVTNSQGAAALYSRIRTAAAGDCRGLENRDFAFKTAYDACIHKAIADAVTTVAQPALTALYDAKTGIPKQVLLASGQTR